MNTNSNLYTIIYSTVIVALVAAILAFVSISLKPKQDANAKAETISQMLTAAKIAEKEELNAFGNDEILKLYTENISEAYTINSEGLKVRDLNLGRDNIKNIELADNLKAENDNIKKNRTENLELPVYLFEKNGRKITVVPIYGAGLWGPIWGYFALDEDLKTILGAYFDHEGETPGLGAKIKDDPSFRGEFVGKILNLEGDSPVLKVVKGGAPEGDNSAIDAITGATMTCQGVGDAINVWFSHYRAFFAKAAETSEETTMAEPVRMQKIKTAGDSEDESKNTEE